MRAVFFFAFLIGFALVITYLPTEPLDNDGFMYTPTLYPVNVKRLSLEECKAMFPPDDIGGLCDYNDGLDLPDGCQVGMHMERQWHDLGGRIASARPSGLAPLSRKVCHQDSARGERGWGLDCAR